MCERSSERPIADRAGEVDTPLLCVLSVGDREPRDPQLRQSPLPHATNDCFPMAASTLEPSSAVTFVCVSTSTFFAAWMRSTTQAEMEIYGAERSPTLLAALAQDRLTDITAFPGGIQASTSDGQPAGSPKRS
jgi:hypothetical protein